MPDVPDVRFLRSLATACFYILTGEADPIFPGSTASAPSRLVRIVRTFSGRTLSAALFDLQIDWVIWHEAVVPVLEDIRFNPKNPLNRDRINLGNGDRFITDLEFVLVESFREKGFLPPPTL